MSIANLYRIETRLILKDYLTADELDPSLTKLESLN